MCVCVFVLPHNKDEGKDGGEDEHGEQNQENYKAQITFILLFGIWVVRRRQTTGQQNKPCGRWRETERELKQHIGELKRDVRMEREIRTDGLKVNKEGK